MTHHDTSHPTSNPFELQGHWYRGNLHAHTTWSDGALSPAQVSAWYANQGFHFLAITDHERVTDVASATFTAEPDAGGSRMLVLPGAEISVGQSRQGSPVHMVVVGVVGGIPAAGYVVLSFPYVYRAADTGLRAMDVRILTEAGESLGASPLHIFALVILPNLRVSLLSGGFLTFATVMGEFTLSSLLAWPAFGPYMQYVGVFKAYEPAALAIISFGFTWLIMLGMQWLGHSGPSHRPVAGLR